MQLLLTSGIPANFKKIGQGGVSKKCRDKNKQGGNVKIGIQFLSHDELLRMAPLAKNKTSKNIFKLWFPYPENFLFISLIVSDLLCAQNRS